MDFIISSFFGNFNAQLFSNIGPNIQRNSTGSFAVVGNGVEHAADTARFQIDGIDNLHNALAVFFQQIVQWGGVLAANQAG